MGTPALLHGEHREVAGSQCWAVPRGAALLPQSQGVDTGCRCLCFLPFLVSAGRDMTFPLDFLVHVKAFLEEPATFFCVIILLNTPCSRDGLIS